jgi:hypothetical protein
VFRRQIKLQKNKIFTEKKITYKTTYDKSINSLQNLLTIILLKNHNINLNNFIARIKLFNDFLNSKKLKNYYSLLSRKGLMLNKILSNFKYNNLLKNKLLITFYRNLIRNNNNSYLLITKKLINLGLIIDDMCYFLTRLLRQSLAPIDKKLYYEKH